RQIEGLPDSEFTKTYFSSITRRLHGTVGVAPEIEFVAADLDPLASVTSEVVTNVYLHRGSLPLLFEDVLGDLRFRSPWKDFDRSVAHVAAEVGAHLAALGERRVLTRIDMIRPVFYQLTRAFLVGRMSGRGFTVPLVIALKNTESGMHVD